MEAGHFDITIQQGAPFEMHFAHKASPVSPAMDLSDRTYRGAVFNLSGDKVADLHFDTTLNGGTLCKVWLTHHDTEALTQSGAYEIEYEIGGVPYKQQRGEVRLIKELL